VSLGFGHFAYELFHHEAHAPQDDGEHANGLVMRDIPLITYNQPPTIVHPPEAVFDFPALPIILGILLANYPVRPEPSDLSCLP
jgi:hypothetical protein